MILIYIWHDTDTLILYVILYGTDTYTDAIWNWSKSLYNMILILYDTTTYMTWYLYTDTICDTIWYWHTDMSLILILIIYDTDPNTYTT